MTRMSYKNHWLAASCDKTLQIQSWRVIMLNLLHDSSDLLKYRYEFSNEASQDTCKMQIPGKLTEVLRHHKWQKYEKISFTTGNDVVWFFFPYSTKAALAACLLMCIVIVYYCS